MASLLYPAIQKLYSALYSLDKFSKENNLFVNISSIDTFFSEFRSITFVLQKSLAHTDYKNVYEELREKYLMNDSCRWLNDKRVSTIHNNPFELTKEIKISTYLPEKGFNVSNHKFTVENDIPISIFLDELKHFLSKLHPIEVFFSAKFIFTESNHNIDIYDEISFGIKQIKLLLNELKVHINTKCDLCDKLENEINNFHFGIALKDMILINDYVYYPQQDVFERAERIGLLTTSIDVSVERTSLSNGNWNMFGGAKTSLFDKFVIMHIMIGSADLMSTIMTVYNDETYTMDTYHSTNKTTGYRKINETSDKIKINNIKEVYVMQTYSLLENNKYLLMMTAKERSKLAVQDILVFMKVDNVLNMEEYFFEDKHITCKNYLLRKLKEGSSKEFSYGALNMKPIINAFKSKLSDEE